ncbi:MAG: ParA family protein [SAR324 cluster bacterium]|nr:ParA family protein [SAR324 cluster bacterium]
MRRVIFNRKGGVGKSTITCNLAAMSAVNGKRTLVIDLDPQCNTTQYLLGSNVGKHEKTLANYFQGQLYFSIGEKDIAACAHKTSFDNLEIVPAHPELNDLESKLESRYKMFKLKESLEKLEQYDCVYVDTPPAFNFFTRSALIAANTCLIPFDCDDFSRRALYTLLENVAEIKEDHNAELSVEGIIVNQFQARAKLPKKLVQELIEEDLPVFKTYLSSSVKIRESHDRAMPMIYLDPRHKLSNEFQALYQELNP